MSDTIDTVRRMFEDHFAEAVPGASFPQEGWKAIEALGLPLALLGENQGGFGLDAWEALDLVRIGGSFASPVPLGETMVANWMLAQAGLPLAEGPASFVSAGAGQAEAVSDTAGWHLRGEIHGVPWAAQAQTLVILLGDGRVARLSAGAASAMRDAGVIRAADGLPPRGSLVLDARLAAGAVGSAPYGLDAAAVRTAGAILRTMEIAGALERLVDMTVAYAGDRVQFGKPIGKQQAIQQQVAVLATQQAAAGVAAAIAARAWGLPMRLDAVAVGKSRAGEAAGIASAIAHQIHGAIGITREHRLHLFTGALRRWRDEFGSEQAWNSHLGARILAAGADDAWPFLTTIADMELEFAA